jgi:hypothetical protein
MDVGESTRKQLADFVVYCLSQCQADDRFQGNIIK